MSWVMAIAVILMSFLTPGMAELDDERFIGTCTMDDVLSHDKRYADSAYIYMPDPDALDVFRQVISPVTIRMFYRTDCPDSVREVPRFIKTIQEADNEHITVECIGMNVAKDEPKELIAGWEIKRVPTFVVIHDGAEVGRVVERAQEKIEIDLAEILKQIR